MVDKQADDQWNRDRAQDFVCERLMLESTQAKDARDRLKAVELLGQLGQFDLFESKKSDVTVLVEIRRIENRTCVLSYN